MNVAEEKKMVARPRVSEVGESWESSDERRPRMVKERGMRRR